VVAAIRPDSINVALVVHVAGAMLLVGSLCVVALALVGSWRQSDGAASIVLTRFGLRALLVGVVPAWIIMRTGAEWTRSREHIPGSYDASWINIGYLTADIGGILILLSLAASIFGLMRLREPKDARSPLGRVLGLVSLVLVVAYVVAVWAMTTKPS
jgi:hypothetical protein